MSYIEFIQNILDARGRFSCGNEYHEKHHIIPKCCGGTNDENNLIDLFPREHFIAHKLLAEENPEHSGLIRAWWLLAHIDDREITDVEYEDSRLAFGVMQSERMKGLFAGEKNHFYGVHMYGAENPMFGRKHTKESIQKNRESNIANWTDDKRKDFGKQRMGENNPYHRIIGQYDVCGNLIKIWSSISDASRSLHIDVSNISKCAKGKQKTAGGFVWQYVVADLTN